MLFWTKEYLRLNIAFLGVDIVILSACCTMIALDLCHMPYFFTLKFYFSDFISPRHVSQDSRFPTCYHGNVYYDPS